VTAIVTDAIVLHAFNYSESSRILRLATREAGVQSVLARGARASQRRFGSAVDLFAEGEVQYDVRSGRDLHTLSRFDVQRSRIALGSSLPRFEGASALAEVMLRVAGDDDTPAEAFEALRNGLDAIASSGEPTAATIRAIWRLLASLGFQPALEACVQCDRPIAPDSDAAFSAEAGGVLCESCSGRVVSRRLPAGARRQLALWLSDAAAEPSAADTRGGTELDLPTERAHRRLLRTFVHAHLTDGRPLRAFDAWATA
jgi:DNA repair protein RecO (recombination protein O)